MKALKYQYHHVFEQSCRNIVPSPKGANPVKNITLGGAEIHTNLKIDMHPCLKYLIFADLNTNADHLSSLHATDLCGSTAWMETDTAGSPG